MAAQRIILATFAGRRERMALLDAYAQEALRRGIIDEWHVWDFSRTPADAAWLREKFPFVRLTPGDSDVFFSTYDKLNVDTAPAAYEFQVCAAGEVRIGLRRLAGGGDSFEIALGGGDNKSCSVWRQPAAGGAAPVWRAEFPKIFPQTGFASLRLTIGPAGLTVFLANQQLFTFNTAIAPGMFEVLFRGGNAEWRFPTWPRGGAFLFRPGGTLRKAPRDVSLPGYLAFYQHYARNLPIYGNDIFLKCDDDIVFIDLAALPDFIALRRERADFFMLSANVINNGVCGHFQQQAGLIPPEVVALELPYQGYCGSLWGNAEKASALHRYFCAEFERIRALSVAGGLITWDERLSINFIALLGADFVHIPDIMFDDEEVLSYQARWRSHRPNAIYSKLLAAHLSFLGQEQAMDVPAMLDGYKDLARRNGLRLNLS
jgi:hypothetical protein